MFFFKDVYDAEAAFAQVEADVAGLKVGRAEFPADGLGVVVFDGLPEGAPPACPVGGGRDVEQGTFVVLGFVVGEDDCATDELAVAPGCEGFCSGVAEGLVDVFAGQDGQGHGFWCSLNGSLEGVLHVCGELL